MGSKASRLGGEVEKLKRLDMWLQAVEFQMRELTSKVEAWMQQGEQQGSDLAKKPTYFGARLQEFESHDAH